MPAKNTIKTDIDNSFYHVYARGVAKQPIYLDTNDYTYFRQLFARHLSLAQTSSKTGVAYPHLRDRIELLAYCLMTNHFHLLVYQRDAATLSALMRSVMTAYSKYFNMKYNRTGPLFETRYKAARIKFDTHLIHISRYIHMNPRYYQTYPHSSYIAYITADYPEWLQPGKALELFASSRDYEVFCTDYIDRREVLAKVKTELADY